MAPGNTTVGSGPTATEPPIWLILPPATAAVSPRGPSTGNPPGLSHAPGVFAWIPPDGCARTCYPATTPRALHRLRQEGLTRHEALHAIGAVLARPIGNVLQPGGEAGDARGQYEVDLEGLSADLWRQRFAGDGGD